MIKKAIVCGVCGLEILPHYTFSGGQLRQYSMKLPTINKEHVCIRCAQKLTQILREHFKGGNL